MTKKRGNEMFQAKIYAIYMYSTCTYFVLQYSLHICKYLQISFFFPFFVVMFETFKYSTPLIRTRKHYQRACNLIKYIDFICIFI